MKQNFFLVEIEYDGIITAEYIQGLIMQGLLKDSVEASLMVKKINPVLVEQKEKQDGN